MNGLYANRTIRFLAELLGLFNIAYNTGTIPNDWQRKLYARYVKREAKQNAEITEGLHCCHMRGNCTGELLRRDYERMLKASLESGSTSLHQGRARWT